jgi:DNA polymerase-1
MTERELIIEKCKILRYLREYSQANKVLTSFITAYKESPKANDGHHYLFGSFKLGGTVSGRLSSANPNLQNQPSTGSAFAKIIKKCFVAPKGWIVAGLDFNSLEDYISALTTKDPMKLKVYQDGFCGHCLRAAFYFADEMPDIDPTSVESVNSIKWKYPDLRQKSKVPTFLLTYGGSWKGIMDGLGFSEEEAKRIEANYHDLYKVSDAWVKAHIEQATQDGYITAAFGLKVRTPLLKQVVIGTSKTPKEAQGEARTAGNALGQSWGLLNSRASNEFMTKVRASKYAKDIRLMAQIHDSQYFLVRDNPDLLEYMNVHLVKAVQWQEAKEIQHPTVKLGGDLSIFYPSWADEITIPNGANQKEILTVCIDEANKRKEQ